MPARIRPAAALLGWLAAPFVGLAPAADPPPSSAPGAVEFFEKKVRPILAESCYNCHSANTNAKGELRVDDRNGLLTGGNSGPAVVPGKPDESLLIQAVLHADGVPRMPPKARLTPEQVADLTRWIADGAAWPEVAASSPAGTATEARYAELRRGHWAWQPNRHPAAPAVRDAAWPRSAIDRFVLARLEGAGLAPVGDADRATLIRRATFDLTGLPPGPAEVAAFAAAAGPTPEAFEAVVDRLLASPAFGERWGRHWLDVARYGESTGSSRNIPYPHAWRYRDYVVASVNADKPYNTFLREQVAGDLLPADSPARRDEQVVATGFLALGVKDVNQRFKVRFVMDNVDEQVDTVSRSVLGLTVSCARCHDHKFDPVPAADYYAWAGIFTSTDLCAGVRNKMGGGGLDYYDPAQLIRLGPAAIAADPDQDRKVAEATRAYEAAKKEFQAIQGTPEGLALAPNGQPKQRPFRLKMNRLQAELQALTDPAVTGPVALGVRDAKAVGDTAIRVRGEAEKLGRVVPRGFLTAFEVPDARPIAPGQVRSGRLELADWLASDRNPLTPRVMANRVWGHLFGAGLVPSVDNFGVTGAPPTHPELLDHLAARFVLDGWSVKRLVRAIVLSRAYQLGPAATPRHLEMDPANRWIWRHAPRRLDAEEIRDATLAVAAQLDQDRPEGSPAQALKVIELPNNGSLAVGLRDGARASRHRSLYLPLLRGVTPTALEVFDFAEQGMVTGRRDSTTVPTQALYLMNDPFVRRQSLNLAEYLIRHEGRDTSARVNLAYRLALARPATPAEVARVHAFLADYGPAAEVALARAAEPPAPARAANPAPEAAEAAAKKPTPPIDPDEVIQVDAPIVEEVVRPATAEAAAWAAFCQALLGSAEFRYVR